MTVSTAHLGLKAFVRGDRYSASIDKQRFLIIDSHLAFLADRVGSGIIDGWDLYDTGGLVLKCSSGIGIIDRFVTRTFGIYEKSLQDNNVVYAWMRRRPNLLGSSSGFSDIHSIDYVDNSPPLPPANLTALGTTTESVTLSWDQNTEVDFSFYQVDYSIDGSDYILFEQTSNIISIVNNLDDNKEYWFRVKSIDLTGNESTYSVINATTEIDSTPPSDPTNVKVVSNSGLVQLTWRLSAHGNISYYRAYLTPVNQEGFAIGETFYAETSGNNRYMHIYDLENGQRYRIVLKAVNINSVESDGVTVYGIPQSIDGPKDVTSMSVIDLAGITVISNVNMKIEWMPYIDPYDPNPAVSFEIKIEEVDESSIVSSRWIEVTDSLSREIQVFPIDVDGVLEYRAIKERTLYYITVRSVDADGLVSEGITAVYRTRNFIPPGPPLLFRAVQQEDKTILITWQNTSTNFAFSYFNFTLENTETEDQTIVEESTNIGTSEEYVVFKEYILSGHKYIFTLKHIDEFGNESQEEEIIFEIPDIDDLSLPPVPLNQSAQSGDKFVKLTWSYVPNIASGYRVWRSIRSSSYTSVSFTSLEVIMSDNGLVTQYLDTEVENNISYVYFITTIDIYGHESSNPENDFFDYKVSVGTPRQSGSIVPPANVGSTINGLDVDLSWDSTGGQFDGYEIWRSIGNKYSYRLIATLNSSDSNYTDENALTLSGKYYYLIRKFTNEGDLFVTESSIDVFGSIFLGKIETNNGYILIDRNNTVNIANLEDPIRSLTKSKLADHNHFWNNDDDDRRINLGDKFEVNDWETSDFRRYYTEIDISDTNSFDVFLNDKRTEILYTLDKSRKEITFEVVLAKGDFNYSNQNSFPFESPPTLKVVFNDLPETSEKLLSDRIENLSATQFDAGSILHTQVPTLSHDGRIKEKLIPIQIETVAVDDGYRFITSSKEDIVGSATVFYDVIRIVDSNGLIASTSDGLLLSVDFGLSWRKYFTFPTPAVKLFYAQKMGFYFALTNKGVYVSGGNNTDGFGVWREVKGMENTKIARDICEDNSGNLFCTSDLGVYKLKYSTINKAFSWQQTPIFGANSSDAYGVLLYENNIIVSNELGIFETKNGGDSWVFTSYLSDQRPIYSFVLYNNIIFAVTKFMIWRKGPDDDQFILISILDDLILRKIVIWNNRIFISSSRGLLISDTNANIASDVNVSFSLAFPSMNRKNYISPPTSNNIIDNKMFIGTEQRLFISERVGHISLQSEIKLGVSPTIYIDDIEQKIGVRFSTDTINRYVCFDDKQNVNAKVTIANQYKKFKLSNGGWADTSYNASVTLYVDGRTANELSVCEKPYQSISQMIMPSYNDRNAHASGADYAKSIVDKYLESLLFASQNNDGIFSLSGFTRDNVTNTLKSIEYFLSQLYPEGRIVEDAASGMISNFKIPDFKVVLLSNNVIDIPLLGSFGLYRDLISDGTPGSFNTESILNTGQGSSGGNSDGGIGG